MTLIIRFATFLTALLFPLAKTIKELVGLIRANLGKYSYAYRGVGTTPHLSGEFKKI